MGVDPTSGLGPEKLARLLKIGDGECTGPVEGDRGVSDQDKADLLGRMLGTAVPLQEFLAESLPKIIQRACVGLDALATESRAEVLVNPGSTILVLQHIRDQAKALARTTASDAEREVATIVYYAAIASALVFHNRRITKSTYGKLEQAFGSLVPMHWLPEGISGLLAQASAICKSKMTAPEEQTVDP